MFVKRFSQGALLHQLHCTFVILHCTCILTKIAIAKRSFIDNLGAALTSNSNVTMKRSHGFETQHYGANFNSGLVPLHGKSLKPKRLILVRHGQSIGNVDEHAYETTADWQIPLSPLGIEQAKKAGGELRELVGNEKVLLYVSPYLRTWETLDTMMEYLDPDQVLALKEEPRIAEQQFGNFQNHKAILHSKKKRAQFGRFFYRFDDGESGSDVYQRVTGFIGTLHREIEYLVQTGYDWKDLNVVVVCHGLSLRLFLMRWFHYTVREFENSRNPSNAQLVVMNRKTNDKEDLSWYELPKDVREQLNLGIEPGEHKYQKFSNYYSQQFSTFHIDE